MQFAAKWASDPHCKQRFSLSHTLRSAAWSMVPDGPNLTAPCDLTGLPPLPTVVKDPATLVVAPAPPVDADDPEDAPPVDAAAGLEVKEEDFLVPLSLAPPALVDECFLPPLFFPISNFSPAWTRWRRMVGKSPEVSLEWPQVAYGSDLDPQEQMEVI